MLDGNSRRGAHVAGAREGDAGLGLARRRARVPARDQPRPALRDRAPLVRDVVPGAARPARRGARRDDRRAVARSGVVDRRARPGGDPLLPPRLRDGARAVRPHDRAEPALLARLLDARRDPGAAARISTSRSPRSSARSICRRRRRACTARSAARSRCPAGRRRRSTCCASSRRSRRQRYVSPLEFAWIQFALGQTDLGFRWLQKACEDRSFDLISIKVDPRFDPLKDDPRFEAIARRMGVVPAT